MLRVPRDVQELAAKLGPGRERLTGELGRPPTVAELAIGVGTTEDRVTEALTAGDAYRTLSLDEPTPEGADVLDVVGAEDDGFAQAERRLLLDSGMSALADRELEILRLRFFDGYTQREIADRVGISQMHVSRLLRRSLEDLRAAFARPGSRTA
jgi:RNA polymerase sigma-B factor